MRRLSSKRYLAASKGEDCKFQIPGVCLGGTETTVPCHIRDDHTGGAIKASDISVVDGCMACHDVMDRRAKLFNEELGYSALITEAEWNFYALRGLQRTLEGRIASGVLGWPADPERPPAVKSAKPAGKIKGRSNWPPPGSRKITQRPR